MNSTYNSYVLNNIPFNSRKAVKEYMRINKIMQAEVLIDKRYFHNAVLISCKSEIFKIRLCQ